LKYVNNEKGLLGELFFHVVVRSNIKTEAEKKWVVSHVLKENQQDMALTLLGQKNFELVPGQYEVNIFVQDVYDSTTTSETTFDLIIGTAKESLQLSSIEIAQTTVKKEESQIAWNNAFAKDNYYIVPFPSNLNSSSLTE